LALRFSLEVSRGAYPDSLQALLAISLFPLNTFNRHTFGRDFSDMARLTSSVLFVLKDIYIVFSFQMGGLMLADFHPIQTGTANPFYQGAQEIYTNICQAALFGYK